MKQKFKQILFSTEMVQSILSNIKRMTRRTQGLEIPNQSPDEYEFLGWDKNTVLFKSLEGKLRECKPKFNIGEILWIRESFTECKTPDIPHDRKWKFCYKADSEKKGYGFIKWKPSIHMPKEAARVFLKVTDVRCERLQDISEKECIEEGIAFRQEDEFTFYKNYIDSSEYHQVPSNSFMSLWDSINGEKAWDKNPWVWVYTFEKIEKPENFLS